MAIFWYESQDCGVDSRELFDLLRTHGFVSGSYAECSAEMHFRLEELGRDIMVEVKASEGERAYAACPELHVESCADLDGGE